MAQRAETGEAGMAALLRKDWAVFQPRYRVAVAVIFVLGAVQTIRADEAYFWLGVLLACALAGFVPAVEWRHGTDRLLASLPVSRDRVVLSRYAAALLGIAVAWVAWTLMGWAASPLLPADRIEPTVSATFAGGLAFVLAAGLLIALFLPPLFRLGFARAAMGFPVMAVGLALILRGAALTTAPYPLPPGMPVALTPAAGALENALAILAERMGRGALAAAVLVVLLGFMAASAELSRRAYRRRGL
jgi:hypothetical protein